MKCNHYPVFGNDLWIDGGSNEDWIVKVCTRCGFEEHLLRNKSTLEFVPDRIKEQRKEYAKSTLQPYRNGELSKEYIDTYGTKGLNVTDQEVKKARPVWNDIHKGVNLKNAK